MKRLNSSGFTLIEVLFSIAILGIINLALTSMISTIINAYKESKVQFEATLLAQSYYEKIKALPFEDFGEAVIEKGNLTVVSSIEEADKYNGCLYKVTVEVFKDDKSLEKIEGFKLINILELQIEDSS